MLTIACGHLGASLDDSCLRSEGLHDCIVQLVDDSVLPRTWGRLGHFHHGLVISTRPSITVMNPCRRTKETQMLISLKPASINSRSSNNYASNRRCPTLLILEGSGRTFGNCFATENVFPSRREQFYCSGCSDIVPKADRNSRDSLRCGFSHKNCTNKMIALGLLCTSGNRNVGVPQLQPLLLGICQVVH